MPGFMSGFGQAFAQSFNQARQNSAAAERDDVRMAFESKMQNRKFGYESAQEDRKQIGRAKSFALATQGSEDAWKEFYNIRYLSDEQLTKWGKENQIKIMKDTTGINPPKNVSDDGVDLTEKADSSVETQMAENGMPINKRGGLFDRESWGAQAKANREARINKKVDQILGPDESVSVSEANEKELEGVPGYKVSITPRESPIDVDEMYKANTSIEAGNWVLRAEDYAEKTGDFGPLEKAKEMYTSVVMHEEIASDRKGKEAGFGPPTSAAIVTPDGKTVFTHEKGPNGEWLINGQPVPKGTQVIPVDKDAKAQMADIIKATRPEVIKHQEQVEAYNGLLNDGNAIVNYLKMAPNAMTAGGKYASWAKEFTSNLDGTLQIFTDRPDAVDRNTLKTFVDEIGKVEDSLKTGQWEEVKKNAVVHRLIEARQTLMAYSLAKASGAGSGNNLSNKDIENFKGIVSGHGDKHVWLQTYQDLLTKAEQGINVSAESLNNGPDNAAFKNIRGYDLPIKLADDAVTARAKNKDSENYRTTVMNAKFDDLPIEQPTELQPQKPAPPPNFTPAGRGENGEYLYLNPADGQLYPY